MSHDASDVIDLSAEDNRLPIYIISNDVVPGMGATVAAPGLRSRGLAQGLRAHGFAVTEIVPSQRARQRRSGTTPPPPAAGVLMLNDEDIAAFLASIGPAVVIAINSNQITRIPDRPDMPLIVDLFAPRILEIGCSSPDYPVQTVRDLRARDIHAMERGWSFIVNGERKVPFYLAWLLQTDRDPRNVALDVVPMAIERSWTEEQDGSGSDRAGGDTEDAEVHIVSAGYLQRWSMPGVWYETVVRVIEQRRARIHVIVSARGANDEGLLRDPGMSTILNSPAIDSYGEMHYPDYQSFLTTKDLAIDLFDYSVERNYAMVTRTVGAIAAGLPVVHVPWSETAQYIAEFDAGWLVDPTDDTALRRVLAEAISDHEVRRHKAENARRLWSEVFAPPVAVKPLVAQIRRHCDQMDPSYYEPVRASHRTGKPPCSEPLRSVQ